MLVQGPPAGTYKLETLEVHDRPGRRHLPAAHAGDAHVERRRQQPAQLPTALIAPLDLCKEQVDERQTVTFSENTKTSQFYIDGTQFNPNKVNLFARLGQVQEWTIKNTADEQHPFHIHVNDFQVMSVNGKPNDAASLQDVVPLPDSRRGQGPDEVHRLHRPHRLSTATSSTTRTTA